MDKLSPKVPFFVPSACCSLTLSVLLPSTLFKLVTHGCVALIGVSPLAVLSFVSYSCCSMVDATSNVWVSSHLVTHGQVPGVNHKSLFHVITCTMICLKVAKILRAIWIISSSAGGEVMAHVVGKW